jgi:sortase B
LPPVTTRYDELIRINPHFKAWLNIPGTTISYPVVQYTNNDRYLHVAFDGTNHRAGTLYFDFRNEVVSPPSRNLIIYGHRQLDLTKFGTLDYYADINHLRERTIIELDTLYGKLYYKIYAVLKTTTDFDYIRTIFDTDLAFLGFVATLPNEAHIMADYRVQPNDRILTLSTCHPSDGRRRFAVQAVLIDVERLNEEWTYRYMR